MKKNDYSMHIFNLVISWIAEKSPVFYLFDQNLVLSPPLGFKSPVLSRGGPGNPNLT